jgi:hypothetical protein
MSLIRSATSSCSARVQLRPYPGQLAQKLLVSFGTAGSVRWYQDRNVSIALGTEGFEDTSTGI